MQVTEIRVVVSRTIQPHSFEPQKVEMTAAATLDEDENAAEELDVLYSTVRALVDEKIENILKGG